MDFLLLARDFYIPPPLQTLELDTHKGSNQLCPALKERE